MNNLSKYVFRSARDEPSMHDAASRRKYYGQDLSNFESKVLSTKCSYTYNVLISISINGSKLSIFLNMQIF